MKIIAMKIYASKWAIIYLCWLWITIVSPPCFELSDDDFESESNELELAFFDVEL